VSASLSLNRPSPISSPPSSFIHCASTSITATFCVCVKVTLVLAFADGDRLLSRLSRGDPSQSLAQLAGFAIAQLDHPAACPNPQHKCNPAIAKTKGTQKDCERTSPPCSRGARTALQLCALPSSDRGDDTDRPCLRALRTSLNLVLHLRPRLRLSQCAACRILAELRHAAAPCSGGSPSSRMGGIAAVIPTERGLPARQVGVRGGAASSSLTRQLREGGTRCAWSALIVTSPRASSRCDRALVASERERKPGS
jgi:hypothetical protein